MLQCHRVSRGTCAITDLPFKHRPTYNKTQIALTAGYLKRNQCNALRSKYGLCPYDGTNAIKRAVFENFSVALTM